MCETTYSVRDKDVAPLMYEYSNSLCALRDLSDSEY